MSDSAEPETAPVLRGWANPNHPMHSTSAGYRWAFFEPDNLAAFRHGARSERSVAPLASALIEALLAERPDLTEHAEAVWAWGRAEARCVLLGEAAFLDENGRPVNATDIARFERLAREARAELGCGPMSEARLRKTQAEAISTVIDLDGIRQRGRESWERRRAELTGSETDG